MKLTILIIFFINLIGKPTDLQKIMNVNTSFFLNANSQIEDESISYSFIGEAFWSSTEIGPSTPWNSFLPLS